MQVTEDEADAAKKIIFSLLASRASAQPEKRLRRSSKTLSNRLKSAEDGKSQQARAPGKRAADRPGRRGHGKKVAGKTRPFKRQRTAASTEDADLQSTPDVSASVLDNKSGKEAHRGPGLGEAGIGINTPAVADTGNAEHTSNGLAEGPAASRSRKVLASSTAAPSAAQEIRPADMPNPAASATQRATGNKPAGRQRSPNLPIPQDISKYVRQLARDNVVYHVDACTVEQAVLLQRREEVCTVVACLASFNLPVRHKQLKPCPGFGLFNIP